MATDLLDILLHDSDNLGEGQGGADEVQDVVARVQRRKDTGQGP